VGQHRLHPALLVHTAWLAGRRRLVAQASASRPPLIIRHPLGLSALGALPREFDRESAADAWRASGVPAEAHEELWAAFEGAGLFTEASRDGSWWDDLEWREARAYHEATRDYPFLQMDQRDAPARDTQRMREYRSEASPPSIYQHAGGEGAVDLPRLGGDDSPDEWLQGLTADQRLGPEGIGLLLDVCFGERGRIPISDGSTGLLKSIPSGGARHPMEVFLAAFELRGIPAGIYHYDVEHHRLDRVRGGEHRAAFAHSTFDLSTKDEAPPAAALVFTSLVERAMWRYRDPRSFRAIMVDIGHGVMAYRRVAAKLGLRAYASQELRDAEISELLRIDPVAQPPLYAGTLVA
jgi:SagB-type dehydrogenase family enzyme